MGTPLTYQNEPTSGNCSDNSLYSLLIYIIQSKFYCHIIFLFKTCILNAEIIRWEYSIIERSVKIEGVMKLIKYIVFIAFLLTFIQSNLLAKSPIVQSGLDYRFTFDVMREMDPMMINFTSDDRKKDHEALKKSFEDAVTEFYGQNYTVASTKFYNLKLELIRVLEQLCNDYMDRTKELLTATTEENRVFDIFINYNKRGPYYVYFKKPIDPLNDISPYREEFPVEDFHFFYTKRKVENFLRDGHYNFFEAKRLFNDPDVAYFKSKKRMQHNELDYIIEKYINVIKRCRHAKQLGIEIYKLKNRHAAAYYKDKYNLRKSQFTPIFDDSIPEKFIVDAVDNVKLLYPEEVARKEKIVERLNQQR